MPRLSIPLTDEQHRIIRLKCADLGVAQAEVARRFLAAWVRGELALPELDWEYEWTSDDGIHRLHSGRRIIDWGDTKNVNLLD